MKAIGYVRVSTTKQVNEGISLEAQAEKIKAYCALKDMELIGTVTDAGKSGSKANREGFQEVLSLCRAGKVDSVVVYSISRFTRSTKDLLEFVDRHVIKGNVELHSISESLDTSTATGRFMLKVMGAMNELEREQAGERTKAALSFKKDKGEKTGGDVPFGFSLAASGKVLMVNGQQQVIKVLIANEQEQAIIRLIESLKADGHSDNGIARYLNQNGYVTKKGKGWSNVQVARILRRG
ncbi:MAG: recombinase family protein [Syntrophobacteraceae bacterium]|jgi:site-specific DNA recombinase